MTEENTKGVYASNYWESVSSIYNYLVNQVESWGAHKKLLILLVFTPPLI